MSTRITLLLASALALVALAIAVDSAAALSIEVREGRSITMASLGKLTFASGVACEITLRGGFLTGITPATEHAKIGEITEVSIGECANGRITSVLGNPWNYDFERLLIERGSDGRIGVTGILFIIERFEYAETDQTGLLRCLYSGTIGQLYPVAEIARSAEYTPGLGTNLSTRQTLNRERSSGFCNPEESFRGTYQMFPSTVKIRKS